MNSLNIPIAVVCTAMLLAAVQMVLNSSLAQTSNSTLTQIPRIKEGNLTYIVIFGNKTIANIDNQTSFVSSVVGKNLDKIQEEFIKTLSLTPSQELKREISKIMIAGASGAGCSNMANPANKKIECVKSGDRIFWYVLELPSPKNATISKIKGIEASLANGTLGYKSLFERTTSPKSFSPEVQAAIDHQCNSLKDNYSTLSPKDRNWFLANC